jgi:hypothetical protein
MKQFVLALGLFGIALGANAALMMRGDKPVARALTGTSRIELGGRFYDIPRALFRDRAQLAGGRLDRLDLAVSAEDFSSLPQPSAETARETGPDPLTLIITPSGSAPDPVTLFQNVYARFFARETWSNPGGLIMRRFRAGTPYEDREIYIGAGGTRTFVALCPLDAQRGLEPCTTTMRQDGLDIELRFAARHLPDWRRLTAAALRRVASLPVAQAAR